MLISYGTGDLLRAEPPLPRLNGFGDFFIQYMLISDHYLTYWFIGSVTTALQYFPLM